MNDIRRTILWVVFGFSMILLWDKWQIHNGKPATFFPRPPAATAPATAPTDAAGTAATGSAAPATGAAPGTTPATPAGSSPAVPSAAVPTASSAAVTAAATLGQVPGGVQAASSAQRLEITTDVLRVRFDDMGGTIVFAELRQHRSLTDENKPFVLFDESRDRVYLAQTGLIGAASPQGFPTHKTPMRAADGPRSLADGANELVVRFESEPSSGLQLVKTYTFKRGAYDVAVAHEVRNLSDQPQAPKLYVQLMRDGNKPPGESSFYSTFTGPAVFTTESKFQKVEFADIEKNKASHATSGTDGYVAMVQHYFASAWLMPTGTARELFTRKVDTNLYTVGAILPVGTIAPGAAATQTVTLFAGPQLEKAMAKLYPNLELVKDYGWFTVLAKPLYWLLDQLHTYIQNWGWAIVALVVLLKIAFYWLNAKAYQSMAKMKAIGPRIMEMRERLKDNPQQMQQEMMRIYREEKVNPMGGCFPILIQIPVFIALYWVLLSSVEIRHAPWILWIKDLSAPDPFFIMPIIMTATTLLQTALNPVPPDPLQAKLMWFLPLAFGIMFFFFPAGLVLYWITNNVLSIAQQWVINTRMGVPPQFNLPKFS
jgi:YidC/Oxa1 family membrane protein insertase